MIPRRQWERALLLVGAVSLSACATPVGVNRLSSIEANRSLTENVLSTGRPGPDSQHLLYRLRLADRYEQNPTATLAELHEGYGEVDPATRIYALAELSFDHAQRSGDRSYALASAVYAWSFLFPCDPQQRSGRYDPRTRAAMDLYNRALVLGLSEDGGNAVDLNPRSVRLPWGGLRIEQDEQSFAYGGYRLRSFTSVADLEVRGLRNRYRRRGIGAPLAAQVAVLGRESVDRWIPPTAKVPVTAVLRLDGAPCDIDRPELTATIELHDVEARSDVEISGVPVPLEAENSATLAYRLEGAPVWDFEIAGFRRGDFSLVNSEGLAMLHPYHKGRIPVVFVHGTASSPARWAEMTNELLSDPRIGPRYQFWYFMYNTGNPIGFSAMRLRDALRTVLQDIDPTGSDPALQQMVVIGHSQGGLLTKLTSVHSGTRFWDLASNVPFEQADLSPETRDLFRRWLFVEPLPFVKSLVFIATPHRGSFRADQWMGTLARKLISLPGNLMRIGVDIVRLKAQGALDTAFTLPTSLDGMKSTSPVLRTLAELPIAPGVHAHSIIAVQGDGPPEEGDDGVVKYTSAHLDGVESELVVRSSHSTQATPETIEEVRRILYEHARLE